VLSIGKLAPGRQEYYLRSVADGIEEYYVGSGEAPGRWVGQASERLGLSGEVNGTSLTAVLDGIDPSTGVELEARHRARRVPGFDATLSAPKSVSILFAIGGRDVAAEISAAHDLAVDAALGMLEAEASRARRGHGGADQLVGDGFVGAAFRHRTSRAGDPQLHTHVLVANLVHVEAQDRWSALHAKPLYLWAKPAGYVYGAQLRAELTRRLGVEWGPVVKGMAEIEGVPKGLLRELSTRRLAIEDRLAEVGEAGGRAAQVAAYGTRPRKESLNLADLIPRWEATAAAHGLDATKVIELTSVIARHEPALPDTPGLFAHLAGPEGLTLNRSHFGRREVIESIAAAMPEGADVAHIVATAEGFLRSGYAIPLDPPGVSCDRVATVDRSELPVPVPSRWTTADLLATERHLLELVEMRRSTSAGLVRPQTLEALLDEQSLLSDEQREMVESMTRSGNAIDLVEGAAGAGKTMGLRVAAGAWNASRHVVVGAALSARAAQQLQHGSGIRSVTLDRLLIDLDRPDTAGLTERHVVVVDEAAMVGTRKLTRLLDHAAQADAKVVLVGDHHQLPEIEAGGAFAALTRRLDTSHLVDNRRQVEPWEREMLAELRAGDAAVVYPRLEDHDRIHVQASPADARAELVRDWLAARSAGSDSLMLAPRQAQVDQLNDAARALLQDEGLLGPDAVEWHDRQFAVGDEVVALRNDYRLGVLNGTRGAIADIDPDAGQFTITTETDNRVALPTSYAEAGFLTHGYAVTIHKAQGLTVDRALILTEGGLSREHAYTALSRGTERNDLYAAAAADPRATERHLDEVAADPVEELRNNLQRSVAELLTVEQLQESRPEHQRDIDVPDLGISL
jgi:conjugative relaxase-like TrwC/TraI family protein